MKFILVLGLLVSYAVGQRFDYCDEELCKRNAAGGGYYIAKHIACRNNGDFSLDCPGKRSIVPMTRDLITLILQLHNEYRRKVATGRLAGYSKANRMIEMSWHPELAKLAEFNVKKCTIGHDQCRRTADFRIPGQNLGMTRTTNKVYPDVSETIRNHTAEWFIEYSKCDMSYIRKFRSSSQEIGHFTQMVVAGADRIGCAMSLFDNGRRNILFACNYSLGNILTKPIYVTGEPCSMCKAGCSKTNPGLCNTNEKNMWSKDEKYRELVAV